MNYEELYSELLIGEKNLKDALGLANRYYKNIIKDSAAGDVKDYRKLTALYEESIQKQQDALNSLKQLAEGFDSEAYFESGEFTAQLLEEADKAGVDVVGEAPVLEMFPYRVRIDADNQDLYLDRKKVSSMRPKAFIATVKASQEKLYKASFNAAAFAEELETAYDLAILKAGKKADADLYLNSLYKLLVPMSRSRKDYDQQSYAFDIARLYASGVETLKDGRRFQFGPSRNNNKAIRILDQEGKEQYLATIRFFS